MKLSGPFYPDGLPWQEGLIIESPGSRVVASKGSVTSKTHLGPLSLTTSIGEPLVYNGRRSIIKFWAVFRGSEWPPPPSMDARARGGAGE